MGVKLAKNTIKWGCSITKPPPPTAITFETTKSCHIEGRLFLCGVDQRALANVLRAILSIKYSLLLDIIRESPPPPFHLKMGFDKRMSRSLTL